MTLIPVHFLLVHSLTIVDVKMQWSLSHNDCWAYVQDDQHKADLEKEMSVRIKIERDFEEKCRALDVTVEDKNLAEQQLSELRLLTKKVGHQLHICCT